MRKSDISNFNWECILKNRNKSGYQICLDLGNLINGTLLNPFQNCDFIKLTYTTEFHLNQQQNVYEHVFMIKTINAKYRCFSFSFSWKYS